MSFWETLFIGAIPAVITSLIGYFLAWKERSRDREKHQTELERYKVEMQMLNSELMVINSARHFLEHKTFTDRSFETLKKYLGGWDNNEDELRKILVSAGAVRIYRNTDKKDEWWYLLERAAERIENKKLKKN